SHVRGRPKGKVPGRGSTLPFDLDDKARASPRSWVSYRVVTRARTSATPSMVKYLQRGARRAAGSVGSYAVAAGRPGHVDGRAGWLPVGDPAGTAHSTERRHPGGRGGWPRSPVGGRTCRPVAFASTLAVSGTGRCAAGRSLGGCSETPRRRRSRTEAMVGE